MRAIDREMSWRARAPLRAVAALAAAVACTKGGPSSAPDAAPAVSSPPPTAVPSAVASDSSAATNAIGPMRTLSAADLPKDVVVPGKLSRAVGWADKNGENVVVFAARWVDTIEDHDPLRNVYLTIDHVAYAGGTKKVLRTVKDSKEGCDDAAMKASFLDEALSVTDLDDDGFGEVTFAYRITCQGHHVPFTLKLLVLENGDKYILRGASPSAYEIDPSFDGGPPPFLEHAKARWRVMARSR